MKQKCVYWCLDDKMDLVSRPLRRLESGSERLTIELLTPVPFEEQIAKIAKGKKAGSFDGLILDLRLDESPSEGGRPVSYGAQSLAQQLRSMMSERRLAPFPIALWSIDEKMSKSFDPDKTSHDLFDYVIDKERVRSERVKFSERLVDLRDGYDAIEGYFRGLKKAECLFSALLRMPLGGRIDSRIGEQFVNDPKKVVVHVCAGFLRRKLLEHPGPLIDGEMLCARLGIEYSSEIVEMLGKSLPATATYTGPFSNGWKRFWWSVVAAWWLRHKDVDRPMLALRADERVAALRTFLGETGVKVAKPIGKGYSDAFTTICQVTRRPLDPIDGFLLDVPGLDSWQDKLYVSREVALNPGRHGFKGRLDPLERERLALIRK